MKVSTKFKNSLQPTSEMRTVKNESNQGLEVYIKSEGGYSSHWIAPRQKITVSADSLTPQVFNLQKRKLLRISKV